MLSSKSRVIESNGRKLQLLDDGWAFELSRKHLFKDQDGWIIEYSVSYDSAIFHLCKGENDYLYCGLICAVGRHVPPFYKPFTFCYKCTTKMSLAYVKLFQAFALNYQFQRAR
jgi:hypothetical protein